MKRLNALKPRRVNPNDRVNERMYDYSDMDSEYWDDYSTFQHESGYINDPNQIQYLSQFHQSRYHQYPQYSNDTNLNQNELNQYQYPQYPNQSQYSNDQNIEMHHYDPPITPDFEQRNNNFSRFTQRSDY